MKSKLPDNLRTAIWIFAAGIALRLLVLALCLGKPLYGDALAYHKFADMLVRGISFDTVRAPGLSLWLAAWYGLFGSGQMVSMLAMLPFHLALSFVVYLFTARRFGSRTAAIALALVTFYPALVFHSVWPLTQVPLAALLLVSFYLLDSRPGPIKISAVGILLGIAVLIRPNALTLLPAFVLVMIIGDNRLFSGKTALLVIAGLIPALLWSAREYRNTGNLVFINYSNSMNVYLGNNRYTPLYKTWWFGSHGRGERDVPAEFSDELEQIRSLPLQQQDRIYRRLALQEISGHPLRFVNRTLARFRTFFAFDTYTGTSVIKRFNRSKIAGTAVLGLDMLFYMGTTAAALVFLLGWDSNEKNTRLGSRLCILVAGYGLPFWLAFSHPTYHLPVMCLLVIPAATVIERSIRDPISLRTTILRPKGGYRLLSALIILAIIQLEWVFMMLPSLIAVH